MTAPFFHYDKGSQRERIKVEKIAET